MDFFDPVPSSDGKKIFFYGRQPYGELVRYDPHSRTLSTFLLGISGGSVDFSPDGQWITYLSYPENTLWRSRVDGSERLELMFAPWEADSPHWSPDGKSIAFRAALPGHRRKIFLISRDGGDAQELLPERAEEDGVPTWSSDGRLIAFGDISWKLDDIALHVIDWRTRSVSTIAGSNGLWTARWSPDGRYIAALTRDSQSLLIYDFRSQQWRMLLHHFVEDPTWSHDGKYIYFRTNDHVNELSVFRVAITNGALERIWNFGAFPGIYPHPITLAPDDTILTTRDTHHIELYSLDVQEPLL